MSINSVPDIVRQGWGLEEEDLDRIIRIERLRDVSQKFSNQIAIPRRFLKHLFPEKEKYFILDPCQTRVYVILVYDSIGESKLKSCKRILPHEYAHHVQFAHESFPFLIAREVDEEKWSRAKISSGCSVV
jgi:hypothetical protein